MKDVYSVIKNIRLSEKATVLTETLNEYVFEVDPKANKVSIAAAISTIFGKKVTAVRTMNYFGKERRRGRIAGRTNHWKKAIVRLAEGEKIDLV
ncbi:MAG: ribosomal protein l23 [Verrucomicrobiales bacterium]|nr:ribosomal protein l23 [Verrucomicrobiales bacterium]RYD37827.1 MAG: 50S ribosomal protein L23 [Verrucomicrobiaceae bacterium]